MRRIIGLAVIWFPPLVAASSSDLCLAIWAGGESEDLIKTNGAYSAHSDGLNVEVFGFMLAEIV
jgi:hypothetical protein